jgi:hypothetical protein
LIFRGEREPPTRRVISCEYLEMEKLLVTLSAAAYVLVPARVAVIAHVPELFKVTRPVKLETAQMLVSLDVSDTGRPLSALTLRLTKMSPKAAELSG